MFLLVDARSHAVAHSAKKDRVVFFVGNNVFGAAACFYLNMNIRGSSVTADHSLATQEKKSPAHILISARETIVCLSSEVQYSNGNPDVVPPLFVKKGLGRSWKNDPVAVGVVFAED